jgi:hypothetical protein
MSGIVFVALLEENGALGGNRMQFRAEQYFQASLERMEQALRIYRDGKSFALAMYCGGLAVECLLRAFRWTEDTSSSTTDR